MILVDQISNMIRFLVEGAINSKFAALFGGKFRDGGNEKRSSMAQTSLLEENYKYGSMPTHPLGAAVAFHAGTIGEGKRIPEKTVLYSSDAVDFNQFTFVTILFKICHSSTRAASSPQVSASASAEQKAHQGLYSALSWDFRSVQASFWKILVLPKISFS